MPPKLALTHFLCLPLVTSASRPQWQASLQKLESDIASSPSLQDLRFGACRPLGTLHLTIGLLSLETEEQKRAASDLLLSFGSIRNIADRKVESSRPASVTSSSTIQRSNSTRLESSKVSTIEQQTLHPQPEVLPLHITLSGLHATGSPSSTTVLYASPDDPVSRLHNLCNSIRELFKSASLLVHENRPLLLHATIINAIYNRLGDRSGTKGEPAGHGSSRRSKRRPKRIDATQLIERYTEFEWVKDFHVEKVSICKMGAERVVEAGRVVDSEYVELCHLDLP
ncbi:hypothetical protein MMC07_006304 [Pseudocyphellaria aurata]|nr:hypothetical protein [Pseudocyphellaria aurata]